MIDILTLFLGLASGTVTVELKVGGETAAVALELNGEQVARLEAPPWLAEVDLGAELRPHRLSAVALDAGGRELRRVSRVLNGYRPPAEVDYVLHRNSSGWLTMLELEWPHRAGASPGRFAVSVNGRAVDADDAARIWLPPLDPSMLHLIEAVVGYSDGSVARDWIGFGGPVLGESSARLTPVQTPASGGELTARLAGDGRPLRIVAVERGDSEIIVIRDAATVASADRLLPARTVSGALSGARDAQAARWIHAVPLGRDEWVRILDASAPRAAATALDPHALDPRLTSDRPGDFGLLWHLRAVDSGLEPGTSWISDAIALAGARLSTGRRRGAVLLVLGTASPAGSGTLVPSAVARYLERLGVPLEVWYLGKASRAPSTWGVPRPVRSAGDMERALDALRESLDRRAVAWVEGLHSPGEVAIEGRSE